MKGDHHCVLPNAARWSREKLVKIGARIVRHGRCVVPCLHAHFPGESILPEPEPSRRLATPQVGAGLVTAPRSYFARRPEVGMLDQGKEVYLHMDLLHSPNRKPPHPKSQNSLPDGIDVAIDFWPYFKVRRRGGGANMYNSLTEKIFAFVLGTATSLALIGAADAEPGVYNDRIVFGQSAAFEGPAAALGLEMREGILAAFNEANAVGGINGRELQLVSYNDGYEPEKAIENTTRLIKEDQVFALIGEVGTTTSQAVQPIATEANVPFIGPLSGAAFLRNPALSNVVNIRASYDQETEAWIERLTADLGISRIAILYQDDSFGRAGLSGVLKALDRRGLGLVAEGTYRRNTTAVKTALLAIRKGDPEAVVMVGAYQPCAVFIKLARSLELNPVFVNISFVGSHALARELGADGHGVVVTQVVPFPEDTSIPLIARYHEALKLTDTSAEVGFVSLEGYMVGRLVVHALQQLGEPITRANLLATIRKLGTFDLDGVSLTYGLDDNQGLDQVFFTVIQADGRFAAVDRLREWPSAAGG